MRVKCLQNVRVAKGPVAKCPETKMFNETRIKRLSKLYCYNHHEVKGKPKQRKGPYMECIL